MRTTHALIAVAQAILDNPDERHFGYDLIQRSGIQSGILYAILRRMLEHGWLEDAWEHPTETTHGRPPRRYYTITPAGRTELEQLVNDANEKTA